jgi:hypothetical protein
MFNNPNVRNQVLSLSDRWELSNEIRKGGIHAGIRHAFGLRPFPSHKEDYFAHRGRHLNPNPNTGMNPGHLQEESWETEV